MSKARTKYAKANTEYQLMKPQPTNTKEYENYESDNIPVIGYGVVKQPKTDKQASQPVLFERRNLRDDDVLVQILYCGVCHSDWHVMLNEWKNTKYPIVTGHEITGIVTDVGKNVVEFNVDDRVAVGVTVNSCLSCKECKEGHEQYCAKGTTETYNMPDRLPMDLDKPTGPITQGGYSNYIVVKKHFVVKVPSDLSLELAAPLLCAGITTYCPLKYFKIGKGHKVGIAGIGGLGHLAIQFAKALGAYVVALTTTEWKLEDSIRLGADDAVLMTDRKRHV